MDKNDFRKDIKRDLKIMKRNKVISALIYVALGVVLLAWPAETLMSVSKIISLIIALGGAVAVVMYFVNGTRGLFSYAGLASGVIIAVIGLWLFFNSGFLISLIPTIVGIMLIISGLVNLSEAFQIKKEHGEGVMMSAILAAITILLGIIIFAFQMQFASLVTRLMGIALVYDGVSDLLIISKITGVVKDVEYAAQQARKAADALDVTDSVKEVETPAAEEAKDAAVAEAAASEKGTGDTAKVSRKRSFFDRFRKSSTEIELPTNVATEDDFEPEEAEPAPKAEETVTEHAEEAVAAEPVVEAAAAETAAAEPAAEAVAEETVAEAAPEAGDAASAAEAEETAPAEDDFDL